MRTKNLPHAKLAKAQRPQIKTEGWVSSEEIKAASRKAAKLAKETLCLGFYVKR